MDETSQRARSAFWHLPKQRQQVSSRGSAVISIPFPHSFSDTVYSFEEEAFLPLFNIQRNPLLFTCCHVSFSAYLPVQILPRRKSHLPWCCVFCFESGGKKKPKHLCNARKPELSFFMRSIYSYWTFQCMVKSKNITNASRCSNPGDWAINWSIWLHLPWCYKVWLMQSFCETYPVSYLTQIWGCKALLVGPSGWLDLAGQT